MGISLICIKCNDFKHSNGIVNSQSIKYLFMNNEFLVFLIFFLLI